MAITSEYITTLQISDFTMESTVDVDTSNYTVVAKYKVPEDQRVYVGNGRIVDGVDDRGTFTMDLNTSTPSDISGVSRILIEDSNGIRSRFIREDIATDYESGVKVGKGGKTGNEDVLPFAKENYKIVIAFKADSAATVSKADSSILLPATVQALN